jgi:hypothetical protein
MAHNALPSKAVKAAGLIIGLCFAAPALAGPEPCADAPVHVMAESPEDHRLICAAAKSAVRMLDRCTISVHRPLQVHVMPEVRHPFRGPIFGLFDIVQERVLVTRYANVGTLVEGTPYSEVPRPEFYGSIIVHEIVHAVLHQNYERRPNSQAAYEYPAYALQIDYLPPAARQLFLQTSAHTTEERKDFLFNDAVLFFDPFVFAARAYQHFKASSDWCSHVRALLRGEVDFIAPPR